VTGVGRESELDRLNEVDGMKQGAGCRDKMKHIKRNDQLFIMRMMKMVKRK